MAFLTTIGLEIHIKLNAPSKLFCRCHNVQDFDTLAPNTHVCPVCTAQPGALPVLAQGALIKALILGRLLDCRVQEISSFDRKSYFYPDQPAGYQITQLYRPTCVDGRVSFFVDEEYVDTRTVTIRDAHIETDTAKMIHDGERAYVDFNRAGTPLVEIVTGPDFETAEEVVAFLKELQKIAKFNDISDAQMEKGQMRVDVNISVRPTLDAPLGTRVELKNINAFSSIRHAIEHEVTRQIALYEAGDSVSQETRSWDDAVRGSTSMRSKEDALDYRYFPEPDLPPLKIPQALSTQVAGVALTVPYTRITEMRQTYGFHKEWVNVIMQDPLMLGYFDDCVRDGYSPESVVKWLAGPISATLKSQMIGIESIPFDRAVFCDFLDAVKEVKINENQAKKIMKILLEHGGNVAPIIAAQGFDTPGVSSADLEQVVDKVLAASPAIVEQYKAGKETVLGFFVGQVMKET